MLMSFVMSGAMAGLAGVMFAARYGTIASNAGTGYELQAIGAAVIGGVAITGGSGTVIGAAFGAILLATINSALPVLGIQSFWQRAVVGALILGAIVLDRLQFTGEPVEAGIEFGDLGRARFGQEPRRAAAMGARVHALAAALAATAGGPGSAPIGASALLAQVSNAIRVLWQYRQA